MATKKKLKEENPRVYYRNCYWAFNGAKWLSIFTPFVVMFIVNFNEWFELDDGSGGTIRLSIGCVLACMVGGIAFWKESKGKNNESTPVSNVLGWGVAFALCYLCKTILDDMVMIVGFGLLGQLAGAGFEFAKDYNKAMMGKYESAEVTASATETAIKKALSEFAGREATPYE